MDMGDENFKFFFQICFKNLMRLSKSFANGVLLIGNFQINFG